MSRIKDGHKIFRGQLLDENDRVIGHVPMREYESETAYVAEQEALAGKNKGKRRCQSRADVLLEIVENRDDIILFRDEFNNPHIAMDINGHREIWPCRSKAVRDWLTQEYWTVEQRAPGSETIKNALAVLEGKARFGSVQHRLSVRCAFHDQTLWYDLTDREWRAVKIEPGKWEIVNNPPVMFRRYAHHKPQTIPQGDGDVKLLSKYLNIKDSGQQILLLTFLISAFIPDFPHVILVLHGSQGSAKSTVSKILRRIVDPSALEVVSMPDTHKELVQTLAHHAFIFFDNVSYISESISDTLCKAVTGSGFSKRQLYSDDEDVIYNFKRSIGINGINIVATRPDLLERSILIELERIEPKDRKQEKDIESEFQQDLPMIMGGIFDVLSKAMKIKPTIRLTNPPRMADFAAWGCAIAQAMGLEQGTFLDAYMTNIEKQTETALNENIVATAVVSFMAKLEQEKGQYEWSGSATVLLRELTNHAMFEEIDTFEKYWPKASNALSRRLNEIKIPLRNVGIEVALVGGIRRKIIIRKVADSNAEGLTQSENDDIDDKSKRKQEMF